MANRCTIHRSRLSEFVNWAVNCGANVEVSETTSRSYEVLRIHFPNTAPFIVYDNIRSPEHLSADDRTANLYKTFLRETREKGGHCEKSASSRHA